MFSTMVFYMFFAQFFIISSLCLCFSDAFIVDYKEINSFYILWISDCVSSYTLEICYFFIEISENKYFNDD